MSAVAIPDTEALAEQLRLGDEGALSEVYARWSTLIHTIALAAVGNPGDAEEITQQTFVSAWRSRATLRPSPEALPAWIVGIAKRRIADHHAARARTIRDLHAVASISTASPTMGGENLIVDRLLLAFELDQMKEPEGSIVRMAYVEDLPQAEIAARLQMPLNTVKSHLRRGLAALRRRLEVSDDFTR